MTRKILVLAANPKNTSRLRLDEEVREIDDGLNRAKHRDQFELVQKWAVRPRDIHRAMLEANPQIVHFAGHGAGEEGLIFEDETGQLKSVTQEALAGLFELFADQVECVVLNGCYSKVQAEVITQHIPYVIGMNQAIGDRAAITFAVGFYDALGDGRPIEFAYKSGCSAIRLEGIAEHLTPVLYKQATIGAATVQSKPNISSPPSSPVLSANAPIEVFISYSHKDDDLREEFVTHLANLKRQCKITAWHDRAIEAGEEWEAQIKGNLESARIILLLISPPFMASDYCYDIEMQRAIERHDAGTARVIPIILRPCDWKDSPFSKLQVLPENGKPVTQWSDRDTALLNVVKGIRKAVESLQHQSSLSSSSAVITQPAQTSIQPAIALSPSSPMATSSFQKRLSLFQLLSSLPGPQFEQVVFVLQPPAGNVPPASAPQGQRVPALLEWAESPIGCGLDMLEQVLTSIGHPR